MRAPALKEHESSELSSSHFARFLGAQVEVRLYQPVDGSKVHIGTLEQYDNGDVTVSDGRNSRVFQKSAIAQVRLHLTI